MKYFVDFEATQFAQRIISIGCVTEDNQNFYTLVKLEGSDNLSSFITKMTGITKQMLNETGVSIDDAFLKFYKFVETTCGDTAPEYYCYGNCDKTFLKNTIKRMKNFQAITFATALTSTLIDYSVMVQTFFGTENPFSLKKMYVFLKEEEIEQHHNALEDAEMLAYVVSKFDCCKVEDKDTINALPREIKIRGEKAPEKFVNWPSNKMEADTGANETNWQYKTLISSTGFEKYFDSLETAVLWSIRYITQGMSVKKENHKKQVEEAILKSIQTGKNYYGCKYYKREE